MTTNTRIWNMFTMMIRWMVNDNRPGENFDNTQNEEHEDVYHDYEDDERARYWDIGPMSITCFDSHLLEESRKCALGCFKSDTLWRKKIAMPVCPGHYWSFCLECRTEMAAFIISLIFKLTQKIKSLMAGSVCLAMFFLNISTCSQPSIDIDKTDQRLKVKLRPWPWHLQSCRLWQKWNSFLQGNLTSTN